MTLERKLKKDGVEIFIYKDSMGYGFATYEHNGNIDWNFIEEINNLYV